MFDKWREEHRKRLADDSGEPSLGRWLVYYGTVLSAILAIVGIILAIYEVMFQPYIVTERITTIYHSNVGMPMIVAGVGIYTSGAISKAWQAHAEARKMEATNLSVPGGQNAGAQATDPVNN